MKASMDAIVTGIEDDRGLEQTFNVVVDVMGGWAQTRIHLKKPEGFEIEEGDYIQLSLTDEGETDFSIKGRDFSIMRDQGAKVYKAGKDPAGEVAFVIQPQ